MANKTKTELSHRHRITEELTDISSKRKKHSIDLLKDMQYTIESKSADYGSPDVLVDIVAKYTGYDSAIIPAGEANGAYRLITKIIRYMNLRSKDMTPAHHESIEDSIRDIVGEATIMYGNYMTNTQKK